MIAGFTVRLCLVRSNLRAPCAETGRGCVQQTGPLVTARVAQTSPASRSVLGWPIVRLRIDLAYDGTAFSGWARQPGRRTVQEVLANALATVVRLDAPAALTVAGRTDAGVHARGQVCHVDLASEAWASMSGRGGSGPGELVLRRLGGVLPPDVRVRGIVPAAPGFDARFSALARRYAYRIVDDPRLVDPLLRHHVTAHPRTLDAAAMNSAAVRLVGEHDFAAYCRRREGATTIRALTRLRCRRSPDGLLVVDVEADAFCHQMVRSLVGALVAVGEGRRDVSWPGELLGSRQRESAVTVMPPHGLTLEEVRYPPDDQLLARAAHTRAVRRVPSTE